MARTCVEVHDVDPVGLLVVVRRMSARIRHPGWHQEQAEACFGRRGRVAGENLTPRVIALHALARRGVGPLAIRRLLDAYAHRAGGTCL